MTTHQLDEWARALAGDGYAPSTVRIRLAVIRLVAEQAGVEPDALRPEHVRDYLLRHELKAWSRRAYIGHLKAWARFAGIPDPTEGVRRPPQPQAVPNPLPEGQLARLLQHLTVPAERAWVLLGAYQGLRAHETAKLHPRDFEDGVLRVFGKGGRTDVLPLAPIVAAALRPFALVNGPCWPGVTPDTVSQTIARRAAETGIKMRYHRLRHRFGTAVYAATRDLLLTQQLMRHSSPKTTAGYAAVAIARSNEVLATLPGAEDPTERISDDAD